MNDPNSNANPLRHLPPVHRLLDAPPVRALAETLPATLLTDAARAVLEQTRIQLRQQTDGIAIPSDAALAALVAEEAVRRATPTLQRAINATGIVLHTGLGRARLSEAAQEAVAAVAGGHSLLEIDRDMGQRGSRRDHVRALLCELTGAEDATVVNNCAGAVFLALTALAQGREVILSRGELVEIGGAFRMPDIIRASGARLVEVGTTNRTRLSDYEQAITSDTALILRCHPSNFAIVGFTETTPTEDLTALGRKHGLPVMDDQGSGAIMPLETLGLAGVKSWKGSLRESVQAGCDVVTASGDKLLGGPQAGLVLGRRDLIEAIAKHPLARALRVDKLTLAALEATLRLYRDPKRALDTIPTLRYLARSPEQLRRMAAQLARRIKAVLPPEHFGVDVVPERSQVGGGSLPGEDLPTFCVRLRVRVGQSTASVPHPNTIASLLRRHTPAVFARIREDALLFDPRTLETNEFEAIVDALRTLSLP